MKSPRWMGYSTGSIVVIKIVVGIDVEIVVVATEPRRTCSPPHPFEHRRFSVRQKAWCRG